MNELERRTLLGAAGIGALAAISKAGGGGPLNPPAGSVAPTGRTLDEVYNRIPAVGGSEGRIPISSGGGGGGPVIINNPGSYILTASVGAAAGGGSGIQISADHVTLDLNGYAVSSGFNTGTGIVIPTGFKGIRVRNGLVNGFTTGVSIGSTASDIVVEDLFIKEAKTTGISCPATFSRNVVLRRCTIADTGLNTVAADNSLLIAGIAIAGFGMLIEDCTVSRLHFNGGGTPTFRGILVNGGNIQVVQRCTIIGELVPVSGIAFSLVGTAIRRNNTALGFTNAYSGGVDGGGNV